MIYLSFEQTIELHDAIIDKFGGLLGIRERGLLESALTAPMMAVFGEELHKTIYNKAAAYLFYIAKITHFLMETKELRLRQLYHS
jgi:death-on-curing protein